MASIFINIFFLYDDILQTTFFDKRIGFAITWLAELKYLKQFLHKGFTIKVYLFILKYLRLILETGKYKPPTLGLE